MNWHTALDTDLEGCQNSQNQYLGITSYPNHVIYFSQPIGNHRPYVLLRTYNPNAILINWSYNSKPITQAKDPCLPVGYCFPASIPLFMEYYNIHTTNFHIPQRLPFSAVLIVYRSIFERMQQLTYGSSRPWCYWQLLWYFSFVRPPIPPFTPEVTISRYFILVYF